MNAGGIVLCGGLSSRVVAAALEQALPKSPAFREHNPRRARRPRTAGRIARWIEASLGRCHGKRDKDRINQHSGCPKRRIAWKPSLAVAPQGVRDNFLCSVL